jgi:hypothetical protein
MTRDVTIIASARRVASLQRQISKRRREIKKLQAELKHERKILRALAYAAENGVQSAPSRLHGGATGYALPAGAKQTDHTPVEDITTGFEEPTKE